MFTEIEYDYKQDDNFDEMITKSLNVLCSDSMTILQNNTKVLKYLTDTKLKQEMSMLVKSLGMAIKHARFKLVQSIILGLKDNVHKLAALEIEYFDENERLLRTDIYNTFVGENFKKNAFITPCLKEIFEILNETAKLSPTNAAFSFKTAADVGEHGFFVKFLTDNQVSDEFKKQISKRYHANFGMTLENEIEKSDISKVKKVLLNKILHQAAV